ncbi:hypothetical protein [Arsenicicoccus dermatophilus]|uniref:hypothetical protein n=1 Tax=Arsenicicoccus dermatophilus TaxID=1076331 RepID=UPI001F4CF587|nr:hypothetical protein [Arsenicicoccus dermatophilus]MCH8611934.1 hypothetical protein [Arsenicicoccus dermatophilus]
MTAATWTTLAPVPAPLLPAQGLGADAARRTPLLHELVAARPWADLTWPQLLDALVALGRTDIPLARLTEGHVDALRILRQAGRAPIPGAVYGVWASRSHATGVQATPAGDGWRLDGTLRFASGVGVLDRALLPVWLDDERSVLLDVDVSSWTGDAASWHTPAMLASQSWTVRVADVQVPADAQVGEEGWYLGRPGFFPGGVGVAAVWAGGAVRVADLTARATEGAPPAPARVVRWGRVRTEIGSAAALLATAGVALEVSEQDPAGSPARGAGGRGQELSTEVRAGVARAARAILAECHALAGPAGLAYDPDLAQAVADLDLYVAQQSRDGDEGYLGGLPR